MSDLSNVETATGAEIVGPLRARYTRESFLRRLASDIRRLLGAGRVQRIALYGSRARGDAREEGGWDDSDWDVAVFVMGEPPTRDERARLADWMIEINAESGWDVAPKLFDQDGWEQRTIFMHNLRFDMEDL